MAKPVQGLSHSDYLILISTCLWDGSPAGITQQSGLIQTYKADRAAGLMSISEIEDIDLEIRTRLGVDQKSYLQIISAPQTKRDRLLAWTWTERAARATKYARTGGPTPGSPPVPDISTHLLYPDGGWIGDFMYKYCKQFESPDSFLFWSAVATLSAVANRKVWSMFGTKQVFPSFYIFLVAEAGKARKGPPIKSAEFFASSVPEVNFISRTTTERLPHDLAYRTIGSGSTRMKIASDAIGFLCAEELVAILDTQQTYNEGIMKYLLDWWDCPSSRKNSSIKHGEIPLSNVFITLFGGSTPDLLSQGMSQMMAASGMMSRSLFVHEERTNKIFPWPEPIEQAIIDDLLKQLAYINAVSGEFVLTKEGREWNDEWYRSFRRDLADATSMQAASQERMQEYMLRLSMILALSEFRPLEITPYLLNRSFNLLKSVYSKMPALSEVLQSNIAGKEQIRVLGHIKAAGKISHSDLLRKNSPYGVSAKTIKEIVKTLIEREEIEELYDASKTNKQVLHYLYIGKTI